MGLIDVFKKTIHGLVNMKHDIQVCTTVAERFPDAMLIECAEDAVIRSIQFRDTDAENMNSAIMGMICRTILLDRGYAYHSLENRWYKETS